MRSETISWKGTLLLLALLAGSGGGCASNPDPHPTPAPVPDSFSESASFGEGVVSPDSMGWWKELQDPVLDSLVQLTFTGNFDLMGAWARFRQSLAAAEQAEAARLPRITANADASRARRFLNLGIPQAPSTVSTEQYGLTLGAQYEVDLWGRLADLDQAAVLEAEATRRDIHALAMTLSARTAELWYGMVTQMEQARLLEEQAGTDSLYLRLVRGRFGSGLVSAVDVFQQERQLRGTLAEIPRVQARLTTLRNQLAVLTGQTPGWDSLPVKPGKMILPPLPETGLPLEVLDRRPDVQAAWLRLRAADHRVAAAVKDRLPGLRLNASIGYNAGEIASLFEEWIYSIASSVVAPLFDGGRRDAAVEGRKAAVDAALADLSSILLTSLQEVEDALAQDRRQGEYVAQLREQLQVAGTLLEEARLRYREGLTDYLPVLNALQALHGLQRSLLAARNQQTVYRIHLYRALGGGWMEQLEPVRPRGAAPGVSETGKEEEPEQREDPDDP